MHNCPLKLVADRGIILFRVVRDFLMDLRVMGCNFFDAERRLLQYDHLALFHLGWDSIQITK